MMSKKHYVAAARIARGIPEPAARQIVAVAFAKLFGDGDNPRFDLARFLIACDPAPPPAPPTPPKPPAPGRNTWS